MLPGLALYETLYPLLHTLPWADVRHLATCVWMVVGLVGAGTVNLEAWCPYVVGRATLAASKVCRFHRWLANPAIRVQELYAPLIRQSLADWGVERLYVALDTSMLWNQFCIVRVALIYRGRALPLAWQVLAHPSSSVMYTVYAPLLTYVATLLPVGAPVIFLADRGFADVLLMQHCKRLGWHWRIRIKSNFSVYRRGRVYKVRQLTVRRGGACFLAHVHITADRFGPVHLAVAYPPNAPAPWYVLSDEPTDLCTFQEYGRRFDIEENFLDDKSNGFQLADSRLADAAVLTRLGLLLALATLFLVIQGVEVAARQQRRLVDAHWFRGKSYLKIGWDWVRLALNQGLGLQHHWRLASTPDPEPAQASRRQTEKRRAPPLTRLEPAVVEP